MTNKPMLSVERELLAVIEGFISSQADAFPLISIPRGLRSDGLDQVSKELRALLDKPAKASGYCSDYQNCECMDKTKSVREACENWVSWGKPSTCAKSQVEPAAQQQGDPVFMKPQYSSLPGLKIVCEEGEIGAEAFYRSPAEPPVPVALTIPEECPHIIVFDDADREQLMFAGTGARAAALKTWEQISGSWNAHLFVRVERNSRDDRYPSASSAPVAVMPFAEKVIGKLHRFQECTGDSQGVDIGRHWFDLLTQLGLLNRVQRSPALWEMTQQGEDILEVARMNGVKM